MVRGLKNKFFFIEQDKSDSFNIVYELEIKLDSNTWVWTKKPIAQLYSGRAIALEIDPNANDQLFLLDENYQVWKIKESLAEEGHYILEERQNLAQYEYRELSGELRQLKNRPWSKISITDVCITLNQKTMNFKDGYAWDYEFDTEQQQSVISCENIENTHRQLLIASSRKNDQKEFIFISKLHPSSRKFTLFGQKTLNAVELIEFITNRQLLVKMRGKYWCIIDTSGQNCAIPQKLSQQL